MNTCQQQWPGTAEAQARGAGFTREIIASSLAQDLNLLVRPDVDFDSRSQATLGGGVDGLLGQSFLSRFATTFSSTRWSIGTKAG